MLEALLALVLELGGAGFTGSVCDTGGHAGVVITVTAGVGSTDT